MMTAKEIREKGAVGADLSGASFYKEDLSKVNLHKANLSEADLYNANLYGADLSKANLAYADLSDADLSDADLSYANLRNAVLFKTDLCGANLKGADLRGARLDYAILPNTFYSVRGTGRYNRLTTYDTINDQVICGCWICEEGNTLKNFKKRIESFYGENGETPNKQYYAEYMAVIAFFETIKARD